LGKPGFLGTPKKKILRYDPDPAKKGKGKITDITKGG
jgi:hypothetical protein